MRPDRTGTWKPFSGVLELLKVLEEMVFPSATRPNRLGVSGTLLL